MVKAKPALSLDRDLFEDSAWQGATDLIGQNWDLVTVLSEYLSEFYDGWNEFSLSGRDVRRILTVAE